MIHPRLALATLFCGIAWGAAPSYSPEGIVNSGSFEHGPFAPNSLVSIFGTSLAISERALLPGDIRGNMLPTELNSTTVYIDNQKVPLFYSSPTQINLLIPAKQPLGKAQVQVIREGQAGPIVTIEISAACPALFVSEGYAIGVHGENLLSLLTPERPARPGELIVVYAAGLGRAETMPVTGELAPYVSEVNRAAFRVTVNGAAVEAAKILYAGLTPFSAGLYQVNFVLPAGSGPDPEIRLFVGDAGSQAGVKLAAR